MVLWKYFCENFSVIFLVKNATQKCAFGWILFKKKTLKRQNEQIVLHLNGIFAEL